MADANTMVQVSTSVTFDKSFVIPSGIKLQSFVTLTIQSSIHVYGKLDYARRSVHEGMLVAEMKYPVFIPAVRKKRLASFSNNHRWM
ncbi:hypothetical protein ACFW4D_29230 [Paenibacillus lactis]|uniref:hypothetical protein n=1 Tax=Paenibacillus lactis TaxID=228574 RepID=UPI00119EBA35